LPDEGNPLSTPLPTRRRRGDLWFAAAVVCAIVVVNLVSLVYFGADLTGSEYDQHILSGDFLVRQHLAFRGLGRVDASVAAKAVESYSQAAESLVSVRRTGLARSELLGEVATDDLESVASPALLKGLPQRERDRLRGEAAMWKRIYSSRRLTPSQAVDYSRRISRLGLGPIKPLVLARVSMLAGDKRVANRLLVDSGKGAASFLVALVAVFGVLGLASLFGSVLLIRFLVGRGWAAGEGCDRAVDPAALTWGFCVYLAAFVLLQVAAAPLLETGESLDISVQVVVILLSWVIGIHAAASWSRRPEPILHCIGLGRTPSWISLKWGVGGYLSAVPIEGVALVVSGVLAQTVFKDLPTPPHPIIPEVAGGGASFALGLFLAVIVAPVVEETFFRGMLYCSIRRDFGVWPSALLSSAAFAAVHPTVSSQFLPLFVLGCVLALLRERTGSLWPCVICHALNNGVALILVRLIYSGN